MNASVRLAILEKYFELINIYIYIYGIYIRIVFFFVHNTAIVVKNPEKAKIQREALIMITH